MTAWPTCVIGSHVHRAGGRPHLLGLRRSGAGPPSEGLAKLNVLVLLAGAALFGAGELIGGGLGQVPIWPTGTPDVVEGAGELGFALEALGAALLVLAVVLRDPGAPAGGRRAGPHRGRQPVGGPHARVGHGVAAALPELRVGPADGDLAVPAARRPDRVARRRSADGPAGRSRRDPVPSLAEAPPPAPLRPRVAIVGTAFASVAAGDGHPRRSSGSTSPGGRTWSTAVGAGSPEGRTSRCPSPR